MAEESKSQDSERAELVPAEKGDRVFAAAAHVCALACGALLPVTVLAWMSKSRFVSHHGRESTLYSFFLLAILLLHLGLHAAIVGVEHLQEFLQKDSGVEPMAWTIVTLQVIDLVNWTAMVVELGAGALLALYVAKKAAEGTAKSYVAYLSFLFPGRKKAAT